MSIDAPLFNSTHQALAFAFGYTERQGRPNLLGILSEKDRMSGESRGLAGLDGAAQAGMIRREVDALKPLQRAVIIAKFARPSRCAHCSSLTDTNDRREAIEALAHHTLDVLKGERPNLALRRGIVRARYGARIQMQDLAKQCGVHQNTVTNHAKKVNDRMHELERAAFSRLDEVLAPIVVQPETA